MSTPSEVIRGIDRDIFRQQARKARPFPHVLVDDFLETEFARKVLHSWPSYKDATRMGREFRSINERKRCR
jgi:hypothetical protein